VTNGLFVLNLDFGAAPINGQDRWLAILVRTNSDSAYTALKPRQRLAPTPYAIHAANAASAASAASVGPGAVGPGGLQINSVNGGHIADGTISAADVNAATFAGTFWNVSGNAGTTPGAHFLGTTDSQALEFKVKNWRALRLEPVPELGFDTGTINVIGGSPANWVAPGVFGVTIAGGGAVMTTQSADATNRVLASFGTIGGGQGHQVGEGASGATIAGGYGNRIGANSGNSLIGGGRDNRVEDSSDWAAIVGGVDNTIGADANASAIGGGYQNRVGSQSGYSAVSGGQNNEIGADSFGSTIAGGIGGKIALNANLFTGGSDHCTIGGGYHNQIGRGGLHNMIAGGYENLLDDDAHSSVIAGGHNNTVGWFADGAAIGGGGLNTNAGYFCTIPGGRLNYASSSYSFAAGQNARAIHTRAFVWSSRPNPAPSFSGDRFHVHANEGFSVDYAGQRPDGGGQRWVVLGGLSDFPGQTISTWNGARLTDGGVWTDNSDRNAKENFADVSGREILEKVAALPVQTWNYKTEGPSVRHLGPVAQDFHAALGLGNDDKHLAALDSAGVALAAIQGLNQKLEETRAENAQLRAELQAGRIEMDHLKRQLARLEALISKPTEP
jgi:hypothetical protein